MTGIQQDFSDPNASTCGYLCIFIPSERGIYSQQPSVCEICNEPGILIKINFALIFRLYTIPNKILASYRPGYYEVARRNYKLNNSVI